MQLSAFFLFVVAEAYGMRHSVDAKRNKNKKKHFFIYSDNRNFNF